MIVLRREVIRIYADDIRVNVVLGRGPLVELEALAESARLSFEMTYSSVSKGSKLRDRPARSKGQPWRC